ncbi:MAG: response regulator [Kofleriaceae bacterium]
MRRQVDRYAMNFPVELWAGGRPHHVILQDLSRSGMFIRVTPSLPVGTIVHIAMAPEGKRLVTAGTVMHAVDEATAHATGKAAGVGVQFRAPIRPNDEVFAQAVRKMLDRHVCVGGAPPARIVIADSHHAALEPMAAALTEAGFAVTTTTSGREVLAACLAQAPDVVVVDRELEGPGIDGFGVLERLRRHDRLASIPVIITSSNQEDLATAFTLGAIDFIRKPADVREVILRARRLVRLPTRKDTVLLRGSLAELGLPALLTLFDTERTTGHLRLVHGRDHATIELDAGRIVRARSSDPTSSSDTCLMTVLDWKHGTFELTTPAVPERTAPGDTTPVIQLLLLHAQLSDEAKRASA